MKKITFLFLGVAICMGLLQAQTSPDYIFGNAPIGNWDNGTQGTQVANGVYQWQFQATTNGDLYFKFGETASKADGSGFWRADDGTTMTYNGAGNIWTANYKSNMGGDGAIKFSATEGNHYVIHAKKQSGNNADFAVFESASPIATISVVTQSYELSSSTLTVNVTASATPDAVQKFWVRYTKDNWANSRFVEATGSGTAYSVSIDVSAATEKVEYYVFTTVQAPTGFTDYDFFAVSINNNSGANYVQFTTPLSGDYYIPKGENPKGFNSLRDAAEALTQIGLGGNTRFLINANLTEPNSVGLVNTSDHILTIAPANGTQKTITFTSKTSNSGGPTGALVIGCKNNLKWADLAPSKNIVIDGSFEGTSNLLAIYNGNSGVPALNAHTPIVILDGSSHITIKNCEIKNNGGVAEKYPNDNLTGILLRAVNDMGSTMPSYITIEKNKILSRGNFSIRGIQFSAYRSTGGNDTIPNVPASEILIKNNYFYSKNYGIDINYITSAIIEGNEFHLDSEYASVSIAAIGSISGAQFNLLKKYQLANEGGKFIIKNNKILQLKAPISTNKFSITGISISRGGDWTVCNNYITGFYNTNNSIVKFNITGIYAEAEKAKIYHNTVVLNKLNVDKISFDGDILNGKYYAALALSEHAAKGNFLVKNNIFLSDENRVKTVLIKTFRVEAYNRVYYISDNNILYHRNNTGLGAYSREYTDFAAYQNAIIEESTHDLNSKSVDVSFVKEATDGSANLHLSGSSIRDANLAVPALAEVTTDIDGETRAARTYAGADQAALPFSMIVEKDENATLSAADEVWDLTVKGGGKLTIPNDATATVQGNLLIDSDVNGTGTLVDNGALTIIGSTTVNQYLPIKRNWYISSPVSGAKTLEGNAYHSYTEAGNNGSTWAPLATEAPLATGVGYIVNPGEAPRTLSFTGTIHNGEITVSGLTATASGGKAGFNLIGNPYPSYTNWDAAEKTDVGGTIWYRTINTSGKYVFDTYGNDISTNNNGTAAVTKFIPPMQAVWVLVNEGKTGSVKFTNASRSHLGTEENPSPNPFKAPKAVVSRVARIQVANGLNTDETIIYFNPSASNGLDTYDSPKMSNNSVYIPEIHTLLNGKEIVINGMQSIPYNTELALGFKSLAAGTFTISATEFSNFDTADKVQLIDKETGAITDLNTDSYTFSTSDALSTSTRFSILFPKTDISTGLDYGRSSVHVFGYKNAIHVHVENELVGKGSIVIYNSVGQAVTSKRVEARQNTFTDNFQPGMYVVRVLNGDTVISNEKILIK